MSAASSAHVDTFCRDGMPSDDQLPEFVFTIPEVRYPDRLNAATELLRSGRSHGGQRPAVVDATTRWTHDELAAWSARIAHVLVDDHDVEPGNRVVLRGGNTAWTVACWLAVLRVGGVVVTTIPMLRVGELATVLDTCQPSLVLCEDVHAEGVSGTGDVPWRYWGSGDDESLEAVAAERPTTFDDVDTAADDVALIAFTSGTTGTPKAPMHLHRDLLAIADTFGQVLQAEPDDVFTGSPPLGFTFGLGGLVVFPLRTGASTAFPHEAGPAGLAQVIEAESATVCFTAPTAYRALVDLADDHDLSSLRRAVSAGEPLGEPTFTAFESATGVRLIDGIGATEMLHIFISAADDDIRPGATGIPVPGFQARVVDDEGVEVPDGEIGRLAVRGPVGCRYLDDPRQREYVEDGWNITGDAYVRDADGWFWYQSRLDDMIISSGYNIAAPEVEQALITHPAVAEVGVIGVPDEQRGHVVKAVVHLRDPDDAGDDLVAELQDHVKARIAPYKYPRLVTFSRDPLPTTLTGKLQRFALRDLDG